MSGLLILSGCANGEDSTAARGRPEPAARPGGAASDTRPFDPRSCPSKFTIGMAPPFVASGSSAADTPQDALAGIVGIVRSQHGELVAMEVRRSPTQVVTTYVGAAGPVAELTADSIDGGWVFGGGRQCSPDAGEDAGRQGTR